MNLVHRLHFGNWIGLFFYLCSFKRIWNVWYVFYNVAGLITISTYKNHAAQSVRRKKDRLVQLRRHLQKLFILYLFLYFNKLLTMTKSRAPDSRTNFYNFVMRTYCQIMNGNAMRKSLTLKDRCFLSNSVPKLYLTGGFSYVASTHCRMQAECLFKTEQWLFQIFIVWYRGKRQAADREWATHLQSHFFQMLSHLSLIWKMPFSSSMD